MKRETVKRLERLEQAIPWDELDIHPSSDNRSPEGGPGGTGAIDLVTLESLCMLHCTDQEIASWRGPQGRRGEIALVWGVALEHKGLVVTAELGPTTTDQCALIEDRFTLVSLDAYTGDYLEVVLWGSDGREIASESLYAEE